MTKEERRDVYEKALWSDFVRHRSWGAEDKCGICWIIKEITGTWDAHNDMENKFPELFTQKPRNKEVDEYWWATLNKYDKNRRIALEKAIALTY